MWILDSEGDFLEGKRVWLKPGKKYLFGRIKQDGVRHAIQHASISRKHFVIDVSSVKPGDGSHIHTRSEITVSDQGSKCGTTVDGEQIKGLSKRLGREEHRIVLGRYQFPLRIRWQPTVLSFSFSSKELKAKDPLAPIRSRLEDLDIKTIIPYVVGKTTHVVQNKRNTAKGLQALINGQYIVQDSYVDALVYAATPGDLDNIESLSPLEENFDAAWPDPSEHLPPPGKEPIKRPPEAFAPNNDRVDVFEDYTFVFCDSSQFENLQAPITNGHGKALLFPIENGVTTAEEILQFMGNAAGQAGLGSEREGPGGVVLVRFRAKGHYESWSIELGNQVALMMDQRVIEQSEFLDVILGNDASSLCRPLPREIGASQEASPPRAPSEPAPALDKDRLPLPASQQDSQRPEVVEQLKKRRRAHNFVSKIKTFDDGFDMESIPAYTMEGDAVEPESQYMEIEPVGHQLNESQARNDEDEVMASLLPGANAMKKRRVESGQYNRVEEDIAPKEVVRKPKRRKLDVLEAARQHREAEEKAAQEQRRDEAASIQASLQDMSIEQMKNLVIVEEMELPSRDTRPQPVDEGNRWDDRWNGRKNFKKFRRKGHARMPRNRIQTVIVPLEEVKRKDYGVGDIYWAGNRNTPDSSARDRGSNKERQPSQPQTSQSEIAESISQLPGHRDSTSPPPRNARSQRNQKRPREVADSDSDNELRFRFRRKR
ncbi:DNA damage response protein RcaA [Paecilomyces variotii No. 5]|uniref:DNA damage response protein RcaA n=1 Tax=Byssochlamys spectabilis (strain No. 5 / NBRC 109023) TaxID=1356009 RepID=V5FW65_BYSSN|nr:DNA damage response protein RcaA [Paecilomyces variotii No. 5]